MRLVAANAALLTLERVFFASLAAWAGASRWSLVAVLALVAGGSTILVARWQLRPGAVIVVFAAGCALSPVDSLDAVWMRTLATAAGGWWPG